MSKQWYYVGADDETIGPVKASAIRERVADGTIVPETMIWREGLDVWVRAAQIRKLWSARGTSRRRKKRKTEAAERSKYANPGSPDFSFLDVGDSDTTRQAVSHTVADGLSETVVEAEHAGAARKTVKHPLSLRRTGR